VQRHQNAEGVKEGLAAGEWVGSGGEHGVDVGLAWEDSDSVELVVTQAAENGAHDGVACGSGGQRQTHAFVPRELSEVLRDVRAVAAPTHGNVGPDGLRARQTT
jgi:hypothetical protein